MNEATARFQVDIDVCLGTDAAGQVGIVLLLDGFDDRFIPFVAITTETLGLIDMADTIENANQERRAIASGLLAASERFTAAIEPLEAPPLELEADR